MPRGAERWLGAGGVLGRVGPRGLKKVKGEGRSEYRGGGKGHEGRGGKAKCWHEGWQDARGW